MSDEPVPTPVTIRLRRMIGAAGRGLLLLVNKLSRLIYILLITFLALLGWLLFTTSGAQWLAGQATDEEPRLAVEVLGGSLWNGVHLARLHWKDAGVEVRLDEGELRWNPLCLLQRRVCLSQLHGDGLRISVDTAALAGGNADDPDRSEPAAELDLPVTALFDDIRLRDVAFRVDGHRAAWRQLRVSGALGERSLRLRSLELRGLAVELAEETERSPDMPRDAAADTPVDITALLDPASRSPVVLPDIRLPLDVYLEDVRLADATLSMGGESHQVSELGLSAYMVGSDLVVRRFHVEHSMVSASLDGQAQLAGDYVLDLELSAVIRDTIAGESLQVDAALWNSLADLELRVRADGAGRLSLDGSARPLQPDLPVDISLNWSALGWPLGEPELVFSEDGAVSIQGDLNDYRFDAGLAITGREIPEGRWELSGSGDFRKLNLERLQGLLLDGRVLLSGEVGWIDGVHWDLAAEAEGINASTLVAEAPDAIDAELTASGSLQGDALTLDAGIQRLEAVVRDQPLRASGQLTHRPDSGWSTPGLRVDAGDSHIDVAGSVGQQVDLNGSVDLTALDMFLPELAGGVRGTFAVRGPLDRPDVELDLEGSELAWENRIEIAALKLDASIAALAEGNSRLRLVAGGIELPDQETSINDVRLAADGSRDTHRLVLDVEGAPVELSMAVAGSLGQDLAWEGALERVDLSAAELAWRLEESVAAHWDPVDRQAVLAAHCWRHEAARLCASEELVLGATGQASVTLEGYDLAGLDPWMPQDIRLLGAVAARVNARWGGAALPQVDASVEVNDGAVVLVNELAEAESDALELQYQSLSLDLTLDDEALITRLGLLSEDLGRADVNATIDVEPGGGLGALTGSTQLEELRLGVIAPFFPELRTLQGVISANGTLSGDARDPRFDGNVALADGAVEMVALPVTLTGINLDLALQGNQASLSGGFQSGPGKAEINGEAEWSADDWNAVIELSGDRLEFAYDDIATLRASPELELRVRPREVALSGRITVPRADITLRQLPEGAVQVSRDAVIIDDQPESAEAAEEPPLPMADGWSFSSDLEIVLGDRVEISGFGVTGRLTGQLGIRQLDGGGPQANGEIRIADGRYRAYGQRLVIRQGQFLFAGPINQPEIYVEAVRLVPTYDVVAGLRVEGRPEQPRISLFSEPGMPEEDVLAYLVLGRPLGESGPEGGNMMAQAALALGIAGGGGYATAIAGELGIEEFQLDTAGEGDETQFVVSGQLGPNLYLSYGVGVFMPVNQLTLRYRLSSNLYLEAVSGLEDALDLFYTFEF
ncbi:MAG: translocation/assembly module TamB domain-containing protein [Aquisalimonadaceae bacterium]